MHISIFFHNSYYMRNTNYTAAVTKKQPICREMDQEECAGRSLAASAAGGEGKEYFSSASHMIIGKILRGQENGLDREKT